MGRAPGNTAYFATEVSCGKPQMLSKRRDSQFLFEMDINKPIQHLELALSEQPIALQPTPGNRQASQEVS